MRRLALLVALALAVTACGRKGEPQAPAPTSPEAMEEAPSS